MPTEMAGEGAAGLEAAWRACPTGMSLAPAHSVCDQGGTGSAQLLTPHLPAAGWGCRVKEVLPPQHARWESTPAPSLKWFLLLHATEKLYTTWNMQSEAVGSCLNPGNYFIISLSAQSCKLITFIADFVYTSVYERVFSQE